MLSGGSQNPGTLERDQVRDEAEAGVGRRQSESQRKALSSAFFISSLQKFHLKEPAAPAGSTLRERSPREQIPSY